MDIVFYVSNFNYKWAGIWYPVMFGRASDLFQKRESRIKEELFVFGILFIMFLYHLSLTILRPKDKASFYYFIFCLIASFRVIVLGEIVLMDIFPSLSMNWLLTIEYLTIYLGIPAFLCFVKKSFSDEFKKYILWVLLVLYLSIAIITLFTPSKIFTFFLIYYQAITFVVLIYIIFINILALARKREGAIPLFIGILGYLATVVNDILSANSIINTGYIINYGLLFLVFFQSYMLSMKFTRSFFVIENLTNSLENKNLELQDLNLNLEKKVEERTEELRAANCEMQIINDSLSEARDQLWREMQLAKKIQTVLLPDEPVIEGYEIFPYMKLADDVGGDYYDIINVGECDWLVIGDVSGHGVPAGLVMMMVYPFSPNIANPYRGFRGKF